ncbi:MAG: hotdog fold thioesterase [Prolixibacteraceae bacterium]|nr:hotdog fold thioesterase [Prolixibacteraceae bacterium]
MTLAEINGFCKNSLVGHLNIEFTKVTPTTIQAKMPVHIPTQQPMGYLHGGASLALAETVGSAGSYILIDPSKQDVFGMQVSGNHISPVKEGYVLATATLLHKGKKTHVWDVVIRDGTDKLISVVRVTIAIVEK